MCETQHGHDQQLEVLLQSQFQEKAITLCTHHSLLGYMYLEQRMLEQTPDTPCQQTGGNAAGVTQQAGDDTVGSTGTACNSHQSICAILLLGAKLWMHSCRGQPASNCSPAF